jgi:hypothetical protein
MRIWRAETTLSGTVPQDAPSNLNVSIDIVDNAAATVASRYLVSSGGSSLPALRPMPREKAVFHQERALVQNAASQSRLTGRTWNRRAARLTQSKAIDQSQTAQGERDIGSHLKQAVQTLTADRDCPSGGIDHCGLIDGQRVIKKDDTVMAKRDRASARESCAQISFCAIGNHATREQC